MIVHPVNHATFVMSWAGKLIYVDPVGGAERFEGLPPPEVIFVTDIHGDHLNADTLTALVQAETVIVAPQAVHDALPAALQGATQVLANGGTLTVQDIAVEAIPMYNLTAERLQYHTKGRGNGERPGVSVGREAAPAGGPEAKHGRHPAAPPLPRGSPLT